MDNNNEMFEKFLNNLRSSADENEQRQKIQKEYDKFATSLKMIYDSYIRAGFTNDEALQLTMTIINRPSLF